MGPSEDRMSAKDTVLASPVPGKSDKPAQVYGNIDHTSVGPQKLLNPDEVSSPQGLHNRSKSCKETKFTN